MDYQTYKNFWTKWIKDWQEDVKEFYKDWQKSVEKFLDK